MDIGQSEYFLLSKCFIHAGRHSDKRSTGLRDFLNVI